MRHALRVDDCQDEVVKALRACGVKVYICGRPLDLLCAVRRKDGRWDTVLVECKDADGRFTKVQSEFMAEWPGEIIVARSPSEAVAAVLGRL